MSLLVLLDLASGVPARLITVPSHFLSGTIDDVRCRLHTDFLTRLDLGLARTHRAGYHSAFLVSE